MIERRTKPEGYVFASYLEDCPLGRPTYIELLGRKLVLVKTAPDRVRCLDAVCPHAGVSLAGGKVIDRHLICPQHLLRFDLDTGLCPEEPSLAADCFPTRIEDGEVHVSLTPRQQPPHPERT